jgi:hypothetical protein
MAEPVCSIADPRWFERNWTSGSGRRSRPFRKRNAAPYEKTLRNYAAVVAIGCALLWVRI